MVGGGGGGWSEIQALVGYHIQDFFLKLLTGTSSGFGPLFIIVDQSNQHL